VTKGLHALAMLGVKARRTHMNSWAQRLRSGNVRSVNATWIKSFCRLLLPPHVGKGRGGEVAPWQRKGRAPMHGVAGLLGGRRRARRQS
jgi:hypothetical protein